jgi:hypothetical protein
MSPITQHTHSFFSSSVSPSLVAVIAVVVVVVRIVVFVRVSVVVRLVLGVVLAVLLLLAIGFFVIGVANLAAVARVVLVWVVGAATMGRGVGCGFQAGPVGSGPSTAASSHTLRT